MRIYEENNQWKNGTMSEKIPREIFERQKDVTSDKELNYAISEFLKELSEGFRIKSKQSPSKKHAETQTITVMICQNDKVNAGEDTETNLGAVFP